MHLCKMNLIIICECAAVCDLKKEIIELSSNSVQVYVHFHANAIRKGMNQSFLSSPMC